MFDLKCRESYRAGKARFKIKPAQNASPARGLPGTAGERRV